MKYKKENVLLIGKANSFSIGYQALFLFTRVHKALHLLTT